MKTKSIFILSFLAFGLIFSSCKKDSPTPKTDEEIQLEKLSGTWVVSAAANSVTIAGNDVSSEWAAFELTISEGSFTSSGAGSTDVWPTSSTWTFGSEVSILQRNDGTDITVSVDETSLLMTFNYTVPGGRLDGIEGNWVFNMEPK